MVARRRDADGLLSASRAAPGRPAGSPGRPPGCRPSARAARRPGRRAARVLGRDDRRRPAVAEVAAPVDRRDLAEVVARPERVDLVVVRPAPTGGPTARRRRSGPAPSARSRPRRPRTRSSPAVARNRAACSSSTTANAGMPAGRSRRQPAPSSHAERRRRPAAAPPAAAAGRPRRRPATSAVATRSRAWRDVRPRPEVWFRTHSRMAYRPPMTVEVSEDVARRGERGDDRLVAAVAASSALTGRTAAAERQDPERGRRDQLEPVVGLDPPLGVRASGRSPGRSTARNASTPNVWIASQTLIARLARVSWRPRSAKLTGRGWSPIAPGGTPGGARTPARARRPSRTIRQPTSNGIASHLCGSSVTESASSRPRERRAAALGQDREAAVGAVDVEPDPALAADRRDRRAGRRRRPCSSCPALAMTRNGRRSGGQVGVDRGDEVVGPHPEPRRRSRRTRIWSGRKPRWRAARASDEWVWSLVYATIRGDIGPTIASRAQAIAVRLAAEPPETRTPAAPSGSRSTRGTSRGPSARAGSGRRPRARRPASMFVAAAIRSPSAAGHVPAPGM